MPDIRSSGDGNTKVLKDIKEFLRQLVEATDQNLTERHEELLESIKEITNR